MLTSPVEFVILVPALLCLTTARAKRLAIHILDSMT
jgi:hypothetical protein